MDHDTLKKAAEDERVNQARDGRGSGSTSTPVRPMGVLERAATAGQCASESLHGRAMRKARTAADDAIRHERFAQMLTPEIERTIFCLAEGISLGLIDARFIHEALARDRRDGLDRF